MIGYIYILLTLVLTSYGQLILKWRIDLHGAFPEQFKSQMLYLGKALLDPYIISSFISALLASLTRMAALTKFKLSHAYPFMSLSFILVLIFSYLLFKEPLTTGKVTGVMLIIIGLYFSSR